MTTRILLLTLAGAGALALAACGKQEETTTGAVASLCTPSAAPAAPQNGDWTTVVTQTAECGFRMGNPDAPVKLIEYGSMTCPHCREFDEQALKPLLENYVKTGRVSFEFRNFVRDQFDLTASLIARCGGTERFFPLTSGLFADQPNWMNRIQAADQQQLQSVSNLPPNQMFVELAKVTGFQQWAAQRGLPSATTSACLANETEVNKLVQMQSDAVSTFNVPGTPAFVINGELVKDSANWASLEPKLKEALN